MARPKSDPKYKNCAQCGKQFSNEVRSGKKFERALYCSKPCMYRHKYESTSSSDKICEWCGCKMVRKPGVSKGVWEKWRFCNAECKNLFRKKKNNRTCVICKQPTATKGDRVEKYCEDCKTSGKVASWIPKQKSLGSFSRIRMAEMFNYPKTCEVCGFDRVLEWAHIVPKASGGTSERWNILVLCPNHHTLFDSFGLNKAEYGIIYRQLLAAVKEAKKYKIDIKTAYIKAPSNKNRTKSIWQLMKELKKYGVAQLEDKE